MNEPIRVLVVDDHPLFRQGVVHSLGSDPGLLLKGVSARELIHVVRTAVNGEVYVSPSLASEMLVLLTTA